VSAARISQIQTEVEDGKTPKIDAVLKCYKLDSAEKPV
jgi:hypothetical protein